MTIDSIEKPQVIQGGLAVDDRGSLAFVNDFQFKGVKRFYLISNHVSGMVRAWHAHRNEAKYLTVVKGAAVLGAVAIDDWENPSKDAEVHRFTLSENTPSILYIPAGYANGLMSLTEDAKIMVFSTTTLEESRNDDIRFDSRYWDIWNVVER